MTKSSSAHDKSLIPPLPPGVRPSSSIVSARPTKKFGTLNEDSSWITSPSLSATTTSAKKTAMKRMTQAFLDAMRVSPDEAESKTSEEDRINCIHVGKLLSAMNEVKKCMEIYDMKRGPKDLKHHCEKVEVLYNATPLETRDFLSGLLASKSGSGAFSSKSIIRTFSERRSGSKNPSSSLPPPDIQTEETTPPTTTTNDGERDEPEPETVDEDEGNDSLESPSTPLPHLDKKDRRDGKNAMFWLCYYIRYIYNVHRLVLKGGHDPVDASTMSFMQYLYPYFGEYYDDKDAKKFLDAVVDYRTEHFLGDASNPLDRQSRRDLNLFLSVLEVVMYLWTPAHKEMALKGELISQ